ncbi:acetolactate decarboxylase [Planotetraspora kaengkrachanensis]|uniref:Alpha-acetolactate decarboxylase n=1 Tax=Planotetraspora kaengkrachanensis TaxID=575193 RepID=A0A8J3PQG5_9ACTN|nr:acetolactate decarboxylase [Planotetraspora kaengkrachanensis]GIG76893.1 alpha-acetolactate decarboxylase [Planotetraspora kaengkrachanensis]
MTGDQADRRPPEPRDRPRGRAADPARDRFLRWARTLLSHHHGEHGVHQDADLARTVYQTSTMSALLDGVYDGDVTIADLLTHGDFGLGTFNHLDGEMVILDGVCYHLRADGTAGVAAPADRTPFAVVTRFVPDVIVRVGAPATRGDLVALIDESVTSTNLIHAIRISGVFAKVRTRTVMAQKPPYPPLTEATAHEPVTESTGLTGTLAGFRTPDYEQGISVAGHHLHFIDDEHAHGGHLLDCELAHGTIEVSSSADLHLSLPTTDAFLAANLSPTDVAAQIRRSEGG